MHLPDRGFTQRLFIESTLCGYPLAGHDFSDDARRALKTRPCRCKNCIKLDAITVKTTPTSEA